jgi:hypothetical protein
MISGEWKRAEGDQQSPLLVRFRLYCTPVGVISGLILFRSVAFWGRSAMGWSVPFSLGEFLVEEPLLADYCRCLLPTYSVEKLLGRILLENAGALESLKFERAEGPAIFDDLWPQSIVVRQSARLCLVFSHNVIYVRNSRRAGN